MSSYLLRFLAFMGCMLLALDAAAEGPWIYSPDESSVGVSYVEERYDQIWKGTVKFDHPETVQKNLWLNYDRGISDRLMFSGQLGYTEAEFSDANADKNSGLADTHLALKYQFRNEFSDASSLSMSGRVGAIIKGSYDRATPGNPHAPGDKANGLDAALQMGKFVSSNLALFAEFGYRVLSDDVPDEIYYNLGFNDQLTQLLTLYGQYAGKNSRDGLDIGGPGFGGEPDLHKVDEEREWVELGLNIQVAGDRSLSIGYASVIDGKNTSDSTIWYLGYQCALQRR